MKNIVIIVGGGIAGLTTALALEQKKIDYKLFESVEEVKAVGAGISLAANAMKILAALKVDSEVRSQGQVLHSLSIEDDSGKLLSFMDAQKFANSVGYDHVAIHRAELHKILLSKLPTSKIYTGKRAVLVKQHNDGATVTFEDGSTETGAAVIVADGIHSNIRKQLLPDVTPRYAGYTCWRGIAEYSLSKEFKAVEAWGKKGRFGYVGIGKNKVYWFACINSLPNDPLMKAYSLENLKDNFEKYAEPIPQILKNTTANQVLWNDIIDIKPVRQYAFQRVVLIGDAAHATTPNLGQGACLAMEDAYTIANEIETNNHDYVKAFIRFEAGRIDRAHFIVNTSYKLGKLAQATNNLIIGLRNFLFLITPSWVNERQMKRVAAI